MLFVFCGKGKFLIRLSVASVGIDTGEELLRIMFL